MRIFELLSFLMLISGHGASAFVMPISSTSGAVSLSSTTAPQIKAMMMVDPDGLNEASTLASSASTSASMLLAETDAWVQPLASVLDPFLNFLAFAMLCRVVLSWYPKMNLNELPWNLVAWPTEPLLKLVKGFVPPAFGVDITPVFWVAVTTFLHEIFLGQQGLLTLKIKYGI